MASTMRAPRRSSSSSARPPVRLAPLARRVGGAAIDMALIVALAGVASALVEAATAGVTRVRINAGSGERIVDAAIALPLWFPLVILLVLSAAYTIPLMATWGRTLGGWAMGIRCVRADSGGAPGWSLSMRRWLALYGVAGILGLMPVVGAFAWLLTLVVGLSPLWDSTRMMRGYADHLGGDLVIDARPSPGDRQR